MSPESPAGGQWGVSLAFWVSWAQSSISSLGSLGYIFSGKGERRLSEDVTGEDTISSTRSMALIRALILASIVFPFFP